MGATARECARVMEILQKEFAGRMIGYEILEDEDGCEIFIVSQEGPVNIQMYLPRGWLQTDWFGAEHCGYRTTVFKK